jgi:uncharacterized membrane protein YjjP (DUF1212 family)
MVYAFFSSLISDFFEKITGNTTFWDCLIIFFIAIILYSLTFMIYGANFRQKGGKPLKIDLDI